MGLRATIIGTVRHLGTMSALGVVLAAAPVQAQQTAPATNQTAPTPAPTPSPTPTPGAVGDPSLQNFSLDGKVTQPPAPTPTPTPTPSPAPTIASPAPSSAPADAPAAPTRDAPTAARSASPDVAAPSAAAPDSATLTPAPIDTATTAATATAPDLLPPAPVDGGGSSRWPWLLAFAAALAAGGWWWMRRQREPDDELAYAAPAPAPQPEPAAPRAMPRAAAPTPAPAPAAPRAAAPAPGMFDGGIVSRALQPKLAFELKPMVFESDQAGNVRLTFDLIVANVGDAPARDIRVEAKLFNAGPQQDLEIGQFFRSPGALGAQIPPLPPKEKVPLRSRVAMKAEDYKALVMGGRDLVVPMLAINAIYRGTAGETQGSASWLVGKQPADGEAAKLAPFGLGQPQSATALAARVHSLGLQN